MILPIDEIIDYQGNRYELTCAAIKRAIQLNLTKSEEVKKNKGKIVPTALNHVLTGKIKFKLVSE